MLAMNPLLMLRLPMRRGSSFSESGLPAFACAAGDGDACASLSLFLSFLFLSADPWLAVFCGACVCGTATAVSDPAQRLKMSKSAANVRENLLCMSCASENFLTPVAEGKGGEPLHETTDARSKLSRHLTPTSRAPRRPRGGRERRQVKLVCVRPESARQGVT